MLFLPKNLHFRTLSPNFSALIHPLKQKKTFKFSVVQFILSILRAVKKLTYYYE